MQGTRPEVKKKIENFDNAVEFLLIKGLFSKLQSLIISNWKIISNFCLAAFLREVLLDYASNMIRIRLNNCTFSWKQREFFHGLDNLQNPFTVRAIRSFIFSFFLKIKTLVEIERPSCSANESLLYLNWNFVSWAA